MAKRIKPTPAGILFLAAIAVLIIALITVVIVLAVSCKSDPSKSNKPTDTPAASDTPEASTAPVQSIEPSVDPSLNPLDTPDPNSTADPNNTADPASTDGTLVVNTPQAGDTANPSASATAGASYYTEPTTSMKNNAKKGYVSGDKVNMRKGPGKNYDKVKSDIAKGTSVTLYVEQEGWWFLKCDGKYGYIKKDYVAQGEYSGSTTPTEATGKVIATSVALRKDASKTSQCIKEYSKDEVVTIFYKSKDGNWYYVKTKSDGKKGWMYAEYVKVTAGKVGTKD